VGTLGAHQALVAAVAEHLGETGYLMGGERAGPFVEGVHSERLDHPPAVHSEVGVVERLVLHYSNHKTFGVSYSDSSARTWRARAAADVAPAASTARRVWPAACAPGVAPQLGRDQAGVAGVWAGQRPLLMFRHNQRQQRHNHAVGASQAHLDAAARLHHQEGRQQVDQHVRLTRRNVSVRFSACVSVLRASSQGPPPHRHGPGHAR
jgi:hypothetical protein